MHGAIISTFLLRFGTDFVLRSANVDAYLRLIPTLSVAALCVFYMCNLYTNWIRRSCAHLMYSIVVATGLLAMVTMALSFWERRFAFPRTVLVLACAIRVVLLTAYRLGLQQMCRRRVGRRRLLMIADNSVGGVVRLDHGHPAVVLHSVSGNFIAIC